MIYSFPINGIRHHAFKGKLEELYEIAQGKRVTLSVEHENVVEADAVICFLGCRHLGYVRTGSDHDCALSVLMSSGKRSIIGKVTRVDRVNRVVWVDVCHDRNVVCTPHAREGVLDSWSYDGPLLPESTEVTLLHSMIDSLEQLVELHEPCDGDMVSYLDTIHEHCWRDISVELRCQMERVLSLATALKDEVEGYGDVANRLQYILDWMGSPENRRRQAEWILNMAESSSIRIVKAALGKGAVDAARLLPTSLTEMFLADGELLMGRMCYMRMNYSVIRGAMTLLTLNLLLACEAQEIDLGAVRNRWTVAWNRKEAELAVSGAEEVDADGAVTPDMEPEVLFSQEAMVLWEKLQKVNLIDGDFQPNVSMRKATIIASIMGDRLGLAPLWEPFETLWKVKNLANSYSQAQLGKYYSELTKTVRNAIK